MNSLIIAADSPIQADQLLAKLRKLLGLDISVEMLLPFLDLVLRHQNTALKRWYKVSTEVFDNPFVCWLHNHETGLRASLTVVNHEKGLRIQHVSSAAVNLICCNMAA